MASTSSFGRGRCKRNVAGKVCRCQEWEPTSENEFSCDCCGCQLSFHEPHHPVNSGFGRCLKELGEEGSPHEDGCQEFFPSVANARRCRGCGCHRNIHDKVMAVGASHSLGSSAALKEPCRKRVKLELSANISESIKVGDYGKAFETNDGEKLKSDVSTVASCSVAESKHLLEPKHKIFLSHSGAQKDFVEQLCLDLERCDRHPFFDKRRTSLPIGEEFPKLIFDAIRQCQVGVVILSEEFFTKSKWPMLELVAMVKEKTTQAECGIKIIPVFHSISREDCRQSENHNRWMEIWKTWAKCDDRINIEEWRMALKDLGPINSVIKNEKMGEVKCREEIVKAICCSVRPEIKWDDSHVEGKFRLCKAIIQKLYEKRDGLIGGVCAMGLYGVGGIGKTTACNALCNELHQEFSGRVCYIELGSMSKVASFQEVLRRLTKIRHDILGRLRGERKCLDLWKRHMKHPVFLCLDNMSGNQESIRQATTFIGAGFAKGSVLLVTARSLGDLRCLNAFIRESDCISMPELEKAEASQIFLNHAFPNKHAGKNLINLELTSRCVQRCYYFKGDGTFHYHPLALQVLGELLGCVGYDSKLWEMQLQKIDMFDQESSGYDHPIFSILRTCYDALSREAQMLFITVVLFLPSNGWHGNWSFCDWLIIVYGLGVDIIIQRLEYLKKKSLLDIYDVGDGRSRIGVHDLWREFSIAEAKVGKLRDQRWVNLAEPCPKLGESSPSGRCWENLERMCFMNEGLVSLDGLNLDYFCNVTVLKLVSKFSLSNIAIDLRGLKHLKSLEVQIAGCRKLPDIGKLTSLRVACFRGNDKVETTTGLSSKLTNLRILDLARCRSLRRVPGVNELVALEVLNLGGCDRLEMLPNLRGNDKVETTTGLSSKLTNLRILDLAGCRSLRGVPGVNELVALEVLNLEGCDRLEVPKFRELANLSRLNIGGCDSMLRHLKNIDDLIALEGLRARHGKLAVADMNAFRDHSRRHRGSLMAFTVPDGFTGGFWRNLQDSFVHRSRGNL